MSRDYCKYSPDKKHHFRPQPIDEDYLIKADNGVVEINEVLVCPYCRGSRKGEKINDHE